MLQSILKDIADGRLRLYIATPDVGNPPTDAELDAAFGTPADPTEGPVKTYHGNGNPVTSDPGTSGPASSSSSTTLL